MLLISKQLWIVGHVLSSVLRISNIRGITSEVNLLLLWMFRHWNNKVTLWTSELFSAMICISCHACHPQPWDDITLTVLLRWELWPLHVLLSLHSPLHPLWMKRTRGLCQTGLVTERVSDICRVSGFMNTQTGTDRRVEGVLVKSSWGVKMWREYSSKTAGKQKSFSVILLSSWHN